MEIDEEGGEGVYIVIPASILRLIICSRSRRDRLRKAVAGLAVAFLSGFGIGPCDSLLVGIPVMHIATSNCCTATVSCNPLGLN